MLTRARARATAGLLATVLLVTGCGVPLQDDPVLLKERPTPINPTSAPDGVNAVRVYLVRDGRLESVTRTTEDTTVRSLIELLAEGPTLLEGADGVTTAVVPGDFVVEQAPSPQAPGAPVIIEVPVEFTQVDGDLQLLATAQLVWTATEPQPRGLVRMTYNGESIELPTDQGLTASSVRRSDFSSVAPAGSLVASPDASSA